MADVVKIGIMGEETAYDAKDTTARTTANSALEKANQALGMFPATISNGGTGGNTLDTARTSLEVEYDAQIVMGTYAGRNLATVFATEIANYTDEAEWFNTRVVAGNFTGIRIFDYFDITLTDGKVFRYRVAAIDPYLYCTDSEIVKHHVIMVPDTVWPDSVKWNTTNTNQGNASSPYPYLVSNLHTWEINTFFPLLPSKWRSVIATHRLLLEQRYSSSSTLTASTGWGWTDVGKVFSLSEVEVFGRCVWGTPKYSEGMDCHFAEFFKTAKHRIRRNSSDSRCNWWERGANGSSSTNALDVTSRGYPSSCAASDADIRALPCFRVGV